MKWNVFKQGRRLNLRVDADSHNEAVKKARDSVPPLVRPHITVEPATVPGQQHDQRYYSQSGPILTEDDL